MKRFLGVFLGILTAIGGFVDMGDLVANAATGARFGMNLAWVVVVGVVGIVVYAEMSGRVAAICQRPVFDLVRERLAYFPILVIANDPGYMGVDHTNGRFLNALALVYLVILVLVAVATIPLMIITKAGA